MESPEEVTQDPAAPEVPEPSDLPEEGGEESGDSESEESDAE
jgi:hypothetical protein